MCGFRKQVLSLDNRNIVIEEKNVNPETIKTIKNEGMPNIKVFNYYFYYYYYYFQYVKAYYLYFTLYLSFF